MPSATASLIHTRSSPRPTPHRPTLSLGVKRRRTLPKHTRRCPPLPPKCQALIAGFWLKKPTMMKKMKRSEEHTSELQSRGHLVCRLLLEKKKTTQERTAVEL